ncbi:MAG: hypothetical protein WDN45_10385 [Caulobacteraceae bacterium]
MKITTWLVATVLALAAMPAAADQIGYAAGNGNPNTIPVTPQAPLPVGKAVLAAATFTTPAGTTAYASGDLIANSGAAGSVTPMQFTVCRDVSGSTGMVRRARVKTPDTGMAAATVRLHLYKSSPTVANGDNGVYSSTESDWIGNIDVILDQAFSDPMEKGLGVPSVGSEINYDCNSGAQVIYGLLEARGTYTPQGAKAWTVVVEALPN